MASAKMAASGFTFMRLSLSNGPIVLPAPALTAATRCAFRLSRTAVEVVHRLIGRLHEPSKLVSLARLFWRQPAGGIESLDALHVGEYAAPAVLAGSEQQLGNSIARFRVCRGDQASHDRAAV